MAPFETALRNGIDLMNDGRKNPWISTLVRTTLIASALGLSGCSGTTESEPQPALDDVMSGSEGGGSEDGDGDESGGLISNHRVTVDGQTVGYVVRNEEGEKAGTITVRDEALDPVGFVTPHGATYRLIDAASSSGVFSEHLINTDDVRRAVAALLDLPEGTRVSISSLLDG